MAGGTDVRVYGIEQAAEVVRKIGGHTDALALTHLAGRKHFTLEGRHALKVPLATRPGDVINDLRAVQATFVFAIQLKHRTLTAGSLFTFSQATLHRAARRLERMGMTVSVVPVKQPR